MGGIKRERGGGWVKGGVSCETNQKRQQIASKQAHKSMKETVRGKEITKDRKSHLRTKKNHYNHYHHHHYNHPHYQINIYTITTIQKKTTTIVKMTTT